MRRKASLTKILGVALATLAFGSLLLSSPCAVAQALQPGGPTDFGALPLGTTGTVTLSFSAGVTTTISSVVATTDGVTGADFTIAKQTCTGTLNPPASCSITIAFTPAQVGLRRGYLAISDGTNTVVNHVYLHGIGIGAQIVYNPGTVATLSGYSPSAAVLDGAGNVYFNDIATGRILEESATGTVSVVGSVPTTSKSSMTIGGDGTLYISSPSQAAVYTLKPGGTPAVLFTGAVKLVTPTGLATDGTGYLYIADAGTNAIDRIDLDGGATPLTLTGLNTPLSSPAGLAVDASNNLYIADSGNDRIVEFGLYTGAAIVTPIAGLSLNNPSGLVVDGSETLTIADTGSSRYVVVSPSVAPFVLSTPGALLSTPSAVLLKGNGDLLLADSGLGLVYVARSSVAINFPTSTKTGTVDTTDGYLSFTLQNIGNLALKLSSVTSGTNPEVSTKSFSATGGGNTCPLVSPASPASVNRTFPLGYVCTYAVEFDPINTGVNRANFVVSLVDAGSSGLTYMPVVPLVGNAFSSLASFSLVASPSVTGLGIPVGFTLTAVSNTGAPATDYLGTVSFSSTDGSAGFLSGTTYTFTSADAGVHVFPAPGGVAFHQIGTWTIAAADNTFTGTSNGVTVLNQPSITLSASANPVLITNSVTFSAAVQFLLNGVSAGTPTGTVTFYDNGAPLSTSTIANGSASITTIFTAVGTHAITAAYAGDPNFAPTTSTTFNETVEDFNIALTTGSSSAVTVAPNAPAAYTLLISPIGASTFPANIAFSIAGLPTGATYSFSPSTVAAGSGPATITLTVTPPLVQAGHSQIAKLDRTHGSAGLGATALALLALPLILFRRRRFVASLVLLLALSASLSGLTGCLSSTNTGYYGDNPGSYSLQVVASSGSLTRSTSLTLNVQ